MAVHALDDHPQPLAPLITAHTLLRSLAYHCQPVFIDLPRERAVGVIVRSVSVGVLKPATSYRCHCCLTIWQWAIGRIWMSAFEVVYSTAWLGDAGIPMERTRGWASLEHRSSWSNPFGVIFKLSSGSSSVAITTNSNSYLII